MRLLYRYVLYELSRVFCMALVAITLILLMLGVVSEAVKRGLSLSQILQVIPYVLPATLPFTGAVTMLFAVSIVYGRMAADNEILAAKAAGVNVLGLIRPALLLGLVLSAGCWLVYDQVIPPAKRNMRELVARNVEEFVYNVLRKERAISGMNLPYAIYVHEVQGRTLLRATFQRRDPKSGDVDVTAYAEEATLDFDLDENLITVRMRDADVQAGDGNVSVAREQAFQIPLPTEGLGRAARVSELSHAELNHRIVQLQDEMRRSSDRAAFQALAHVAHGKLGLVDWQGKASLAAINVREAQRTIWRYECEKQLRIVVSCSCFFFSLLGCPVAVWLQRGDYLSAFVSCFLPIVTLYYPLVMLSLNLGKEGLAPPEVMWTANLILAALAGLMVRPVWRY
jgi:lipopolysaccharide export system permease protein